MSNCFRRRNIERVHGQSNQATVARERDCLDQLLADVEHLSAMDAAGLLYASAGRTGSQVTTMLTLNLEPHRRVNFLRGDR